MVLLLARPSTPSATRPGLGADLLPVDAERVPGVAHPVDLGHDGRARRVGGVPGRGEVLEPVGEVLLGGAVDVLPEVAGVEHLDLRGANPLSGAVGQRPADRVRHRSRDASAGPALTGTTVRPSRPEHQSGGEPSQTRSSARCRSGHSPISQLRRGSPSQLTRSYCSAIVFCAVPPFTLAYFTVMLPAPFTQVLHGPRRLAGLAVADA